MRKILVDVILRLLLRKMQHRQISHFSMSAILKLPPQERDMATYITLTHKIKGKKCTKGSWTMYTFKI